MASLRTLFRERPGIRAPRSPRPRGALARSQLRGPRGPRHPNPQLQDGSSCRAHTHTHMHTHACTHMHTQRPFINSGLRALGCAGWERPCYSWSPSPAMDLQNPTLRTSQVPDRVVGVGNMAQVLRAHLSPVSCHPSGLYSQSHHFHSKLFNLTEPQCPLGPVWCMGPFPALMEDGNEMLVPLLP